MRPHQFNHHTLEQIVKDKFPTIPLDQNGLKRAIPKLAKDKATVRTVESIVRGLPTFHQLFLKDSREMDRIGDESVHLVVTSPPYWTLKEYPDIDGQLGLIQEFDRFLDELDKVWRHCLRVLVPGGRLIVVVGDVCLSRRKHKRHLVMPLHAAIQERCRKIGFDNLAPIIWYKISNATFEIENGTSYLGKPYEPNAIIKNDIEYILMQRKAGAYRKPNLTARLLSLISETDHRNWFRQVWELPGASTENHPAPYPLDLVVRLIRMFSFVGDTVLDPFMGTGTTNLAGSLWGRDSIGFEIDPTYFRQAGARLEERHGGLFISSKSDIVSENETNLSQKTLKLTVDPRGVPSS